MLNEERRTYILSTRSRLAHSLMQDEILVWISVRPVITRCSNVFNPIELMPDKILEECEE